MFPLQEYEAKAHGFSRGRRSRWIVARQTTGEKYNIDDIKLISTLWFCTNAMATGKVDFFNDTGGYGFIETDDADEDVFFHMEDVGGPDLEEGQEVEFEIEEADKGPRAKNLTRL